MSDLKRFPLMVVFVCYGNHAVIKHFFTPEVRDVPKALQHLATHSTRTYPINCEILRVFSTTQLKIIVCGFLVLPKRRLVLVPFPEISRFEMP